MRPLLLLIDLQNDFLAAPGLEPSRGEILRGASRLLCGFRSLGLPVAHVLTTVHRDRDDRMPHWKSRGKWACVEGTPGHEPPDPVRPADAEAVLSKRFFSAFSSPALEPLLASRDSDAVILAGVHLHGCVRATAIDAYARGLDVWIAEDAIGSDDPLHAAVTRRYLGDRAARFAPSEAILASLAGSDLGAPGGPPPRRLPSAVVAGIPREGGDPDGDLRPHASPREARRLLFSVPRAGAAEALAAATAAREALAAWQDTAVSERGAILVRTAGALELRADGLAHKLAEEIGKPVSLAAAEARRAAELLRRAARDEPSPPGGPGASWRRRPLGVVAAVTPWNNPLAIPAGKIAAALFHGNAIVWKPAPAATSIALDLLDALREGGVPDGLVDLVAGDGATAAALLDCEEIDAVTWTGSSASGWAAQAACARRRIPLQAELAGNNAAIVWDGADVDASARAIAGGAFSFAGQRCTANRRAIVAERLFATFRERVLEAAAASRWGDPLEPGIEVGPLLTREARARVAAAVDRAGEDAEEIVAPLRGSDLAARLERTGHYHPPTVVVAPAPDAEIVREETFGPVLVVQRAREFEEALALAEGVPQGLVASLFGGRAEERRRFSERVRAGVLKWEETTCDVDAVLPFGGWKHSGLGPPERGDGDREFFTRAQALYGEP